MARSSLIPGRVKNTGIDLLVAGVLFGGSLIALSYANKKFGILNKLVGGAASLGLAVGQAVGVGVGSIPTGIGQGALSVFTPGGAQSDATRNLLGLSSEKNGILNFPFTNIPIPGQTQNGIPTNTIGNPISVPNVYGTLPQTTPANETGSFASQVSVPNFTSVLNQVAPRAMAASSGVLYPSGYGFQPLNLTNTNVGIGTVGISPGVLARQQALSQKFGIITFDTKGNISTVGGARAGRV
jgi:hypothetical protein